MKIFSSHEACTPSENFADYLATCVAVYNFMHLEEDHPPRVKELYLLGDFILVHDNEGLVFSVQVENLPVED